MLEIDKKLWDSDCILKITSTIEWSSSDTDILLTCFLNDLKELLVFCIENNKRSVLLVVCDKGTVPSFYYLGKIFTFFYSIRDLINDSVDFTILYGEEDSIGVILPTILKIYKPMRPIHIINTKSELKKKLKERSS